MNVSEVKRELYDHMGNVLSDMSVPRQQTVEAARYVALNESGGLHRPLLLFATAEGYSIPIKRALPLGAAVEFIHSASLIDDDIADKSDLRRGKPSCHIAFGEDVARLANTFLVQKAYGQIAEGNDFSLKKKVEIIARAHDVGARMCLGQERDITQDGLDKYSDVVRMYERKTGALIGLALSIGGIIGGASQEEVEALSRIGVNAGVSYQIIDDALDNIADERDTGKPKNQDANKKTLLNLIGWDNVKALKKERDSEIDKLLYSFDGEFPMLETLLKKLTCAHDNRLVNI